MKFNFGCGSNILDGWRNFDVSHPDPRYRCDITKPLPFDGGCADFILAEHVVEHVSCPDGLRFFEECLRILKPRGVLRICVPHLGRIKDKAHARDLVVGHGHLVMFTEQSLIDLLILAGFETVSITDRKECDGHWRVIGEHKDYVETLRVEGTKA